MLDEFILTKVPAFVEYLRGEAAAVAIVHDDICEVIVLDDMMEGNDVGMSGGKLVETDLTQVQSTSTG